MPRRTLPFLTLTITWWLSLVPAGWAQQDVQAAAVDGAPGPIVAHAARAPDSHRLKRNYAHTPVALTITLPPITRAQQAASTETEEPERPGPLQIGFGRDMPDTDRGDLAPRLAWETQSDGSQVSALSVSSPGARAVRVALRGTLPTGAEVRFFSPADPEQRFPPVQPADVSPGLAAETPAGAPAEESAPLWSPVVEGDTVGVEISLPSPAAVSDVSLFIDRVSHLSVSVRQATPQQRSDIGDAASCHIDVACRTTTPRNLAAATAKMIYTKRTGGSFLCTGVLLNDTDGSSFIPYFLTANHCINTQTVARTLDTYWEFERASCGGVQPYRVNQLTGGADLLATDRGTDSTLLRLRETPLTDTWYAGWDPQPLPYPTEVIGIHHPQGDLKKWSRGRAVRNTTIILRDEDQRVSAIRVEWTEGTVEGGSSGSGLFDTRGRLRGVLSGTPVGQTACGLSRSASSGRFDLFYPRVSRWLAPASGPSDHGDTRAEATSLQPDTEEAGDLDRSGDVDYFRIEVPEAGRLTVETTGSTDTVGYLQDAQGQPLAEDDNTGADANFRIVRQVPAGTYYVGVVGAPHRPVDDHGNTAEEATRVGLDSTTAGVLEQGGDVDYFRVTVTKAGTLTVETSGTTDTKGSLLRATGTTLAENDDAGAGDNFRIVQQVAAGTYYVAVRGYDADETGSYTLRTLFTARPAADDHGDTLGRATRVGLNSTTAGSIEHADDTDYFRMTITQAGTLTVETTGTTDTYGYLQNAAGTTLAENDDGGVGRNFQIVEHVTTGTYYVEVEGFDEEDIGPYTLRVRFAASPRPSRSGLRSLPGTWQFTFRILGTAFTDVYRLNSMTTTATGLSTLVGTDEYGGPVVVNNVQDISPGTSLPYEFALLDPGIIICKFYLFNKTGSNSVSGVYHQVRDGDCETSGGLSDPYSMIGVRTSLSTRASQAELQPQTTMVDQERVELRKAEEAEALEGKSTSRTARSARTNDNLLIDIVKSLSRQLEKHK